MRGLFCLLAFFGGVTFLYGEIKVSYPPLPKEKGGLSESDERFLIDFLEKAKKSLEPNSCPGGLSSASFFENDGKKLCYFKQMSEPAKWCFEQKGIDFLSQPLVIGDRLFMVARSIEEREGAETLPTQDKQTLYLMTHNMKDGNLLSQQKIAMKEGRDDLTSHEGWMLRQEDFFPYRLFVSNEGIELVTEVFAAQFDMGGKLRNLVSTDKDYSSVLNNKFDQAFGHLEDALKDENEAMTKTAAANLALLKSDKAHKILEGNLNHRHPEVQIHAIQSIGIYRTKGGVIQLKDKLTSEKTDSSLYPFLFEALMRIRTEESQKAVADVLMESKNPLIKKGGIERMINLNYWEGLSVVQRLIKDPNENRGVVEQAIYAVGHLMEKKEAKKFFSDLPENTKASFKDAIEIAKRLR